MAVIKNNTSESRRAARADERTPRQVSQAGVGATKTAKITVTNSFSAISITDDIHMMTISNTSNRDIALVINNTDDQFYLLEAGKSVERVVVSMGIDVRVKIATGQGSVEIDLLLEG